MPTTRVRALIACLSLASATLASGAAIANASATGSAGSGTIGGPRVSLTYDELAYGYARGSLFTTGDLADCTVGVTSSAEVAKFVMDGGGVAYLAPLTTKGRDSGIYGVGGGGADEWRVRELRIDHNNSIYAVLQCEVEGKTLSAVAEYGGRSAGAIRQSNLGLSFGS